MTVNSQLSTPPWGREQVPFPCLPHSVYNLGAMLRRFYQIVIIASVVRFVFNLSYAIFMPDFRLVDPSSGESPSPFNSTMIHLMPLLVFLIPLFFIKVGGLTTPMKGIVSAMFAFVAFKEINGVLQLHRNIPTPDGLQTLMSSVEVLYVVVLLLSLYWLWNAYPEIKVRLKATNEDGKIFEDEFDPDTMERL